MTDVKRAMIVMHDLPADTAESIKDAVRARGEQLGAEVIIIELIDLMGQINGTAPRTLTQEQIDWARKHLEAPGVPPESALVGQRLYLLQDSHGSDGAETWDYQRVLARNAHAQYLNQNIANFESSVRDILASRGGWR